MATTVAVDFNKQTNKQEKTQQKQQKKNIRYLNTVIVASSKCPAVQFDSKL